MRPAVDLNLRSEPIQLKDGRQLPAERGSLRVPAVWSQPEAGHFELAFVRVPGSNKDRSQAIFYLPGGPGFSQLQNLSFLMAELFRPPPDLGDFIVVEQRGVGLSRPQLDCPGTYSLPFDRPLDREILRSAHREYIAEAVVFWEEQGVNLAGLDARNMAADVNALQKALGYDRISLMGGSFGSHHALAVMRAFGTAVHRVILKGVEGPDHTMKLPSSIQRVLDQLDKLLALDNGWSSRMNSLTEVMSEILAGLERSPVRVETANPKTGILEPISLGKLDLQWITAEGLGSAKFQQALPGRYWQMRQGDFTWLAAQAARMRLERSSNLVYEAVDCASGGTEARKVRIRAEAPHTMLEDVINETVFDLCGVFGPGHDLGDEFRGPVQSEVPALVVAGSLDARTPVANAEEVLQSLPNGHLIVVDGASHDVAVRGDHLEALAELQRNFLAGGQVEKTRLSAGFAFDALS